MYLFELRGAPRFVRSDNGPEFVADAVKAWLERSGCGTLYIDPGSPWENAYVESFNGKPQDELLNREQFGTLKEAKVLVEDHRLDYNHPPAAQRARLHRPRGIRGGVQGEDEEEGMPRVRGMRREALSFGRHQGPSADVFWRGSNYQDQTLIAAGPKNGGRSSLLLLQRVLCSENRGVRGG